MLYFAKPNDTLNTMKKKITLLSLVIVQFLYGVRLFAQIPSEIRINPTNWWVGMKNPNVQLLLYAKNIAQNKFSLEKYKGVKLKKVQKVENPNYLFVDLEISPTAKAGQLNFNLSSTNSTATLTYQLLPRSTYKPQQVSPADLIYLILPDRFANGDYSNDKFADMADPEMNRESPWLRHGGDLKGIENHLDYIKELGITALWLNPVIENDQPQTNEGGTMRSAYHGYGFTDQYNVDKRLGGNEAYKQLIEKSHANGLKVIQDAVYNHFGINHWILKDLPFKEWLHQWPTYTQTSFKETPVLDPHSSEYDKKIMTDGWFMPFLPDVNQDNEMVANYLIQHAIWTVEYFGIDAWRIDTYMYNDIKFMNKCNAALQNEYPTLLLFGESLASSVSNQAYFVQNNLNIPTKCNLPSTLDYQLFIALKDALKQKYGWGEGINRLYSLLSQDYLYQSPENLVTYLDNHDEHRFLSEIGEDTDKLKMGITWLLTLRGIPQVYYGTEILMKNFKDPTDAEVRKDFPGGWKEDKINKFTKEGRTPAENDFFEYFKKVSAFRKTSEAIANGKFMQFMPFDDGMYVYFRYSTNEKIMVVSNTGIAQKQLSLARFKEMLGNTTKGYDVLANKEVVLDGFTVEPKQCFIFKIN